MNSVEDLLGRLTSTQWKGGQSNELEIHWLDLRSDHIKTSLMLHKDHHSRIGDRPDQEWTDIGHLPQYFDPKSLELGLGKIAGGTATTCKVQLTHSCGNTDDGFVHAAIEDEELEIEQLAPGEFEIRLISRGSNTGTYRAVASSENILPGIWDSLAATCPKCQSNNVVDENDFEYNEVATRQTEFVGTRRCKICGTRWRIKGTDWD
jgi:hypothetical protein